jgi:hypothetical protein
MSVVQLLFVPRLHGAGSGSLVDPDSGHCGACSQVFPDSARFLCLYHVWQAWHKNVCQKARTRTQANIRAIVEELKTLMYMKLPKENRHAAAMASIEAFLGRLRDKQELAFEAYFIREWRCCLGGCRTPPLHNNWSLCALHMPPS